MRLPTKKMQAWEPLNALIDDDKGPLKMFSLTLSNLCKMTTRSRQPKVAHKPKTMWAKIQLKEEKELTLSHFMGVWSVTGICLTEPLPRASRFLWLANKRSSFFSSSLRLLQNLHHKDQKMNFKAETYFFLISSYLVSLSWGGSCCNSCLMRCFSPIEFTYGTLSSGRLEKYRWTWKVRKSGEIKNLSIDKPDGLNKSDSWLPNPNSNYSFFSLYWFPQFPQPIWSHVDITTKSAQIEEPPLTSW